MIESPLPFVSHKTAPFRAPVLCGNRSSGVQPISVNRQPCSCFMQWSDRELTAFGMSHRTAPPEPLFYVGTGAKPLSVNRQPCLSVSLDCSQQLIQCRSRRLPTIPSFTRGWGRNIFVSFKPTGPGTEPRILA